MPRRALMPTAPPPAFALDHLADFGEVADGALDFSHAVAHGEFF